MDATAIRWFRCADIRTRIVSLVDSRMLVRVLPPETVLSDLRYERIGGRLSLVGAGFNLDINEFDAQR
jgi:radical SAM superfamily enzyme with C-terminal helix-hairpin-helix motif